MPQRDRRSPGPRPALERTRRGLLYVALALALFLLGVDRYAAWAHRPGADSTRIVLYTTAWCGYCAALREQLSAADVPFIEHDVEKSLAGQLGFWTLRARGVPVSVIGPQVIHGYRERSLEAALAKLGYSLDLVSAGTGGREDRAQSMPH
jgi:glutaredoxin